MEPHRSIRTHDVDERRALDVDVDGFRTTTVPDDRLLHEGARAEHVRTEHRIRLSPGSISAIVAGSAMAIWSSVLVARAGLAAPLDDPVVDVMELSGTSLLGLATGAVGVVLLLAGVARSRGSIVMIAALIVIAGATIAIEPGAADGALGTERAFGIALAAIGFVVGLIALAAPDVDRRDIADDVQRS